MMLLNTLFLKGIYTTTSSILLLFGQVIWNRIPLKHSAFYFTPSKALNLKVVLSLPKTAKLVYGKKMGQNPTPQQWAAQANPELCSLCL